MEAKCELSVLEVIFLDAWGALCYRLYVYSLFQAFSWEAAQKNGISTKNGEWKSATGFEVSLELALIFFSLAILFTAPQLKYGAPPHVVY